MTRALSAMPSSMYGSSVPVFIRLPTGLGECIDKAVARAARRDYGLAVLAATHLPHIRAAGLAPVGQDMDFPI